MSANVPISKSLICAAASGDVLPVAVVTAPGVLMSPGRAEPGVLISPANAETLRVKAKTVAVQTAFIVFMIFSPIQFFRVIRLIKAVEHERWESQLRDC